MKKLLLSLTFMLFSVGLFAQDHYFHELKGMEDSVGVTHLFYRYYQEFDLEDSWCGIERENNIYH